MMARCLLSSDEQTREVRHSLTITIDTVASAISALRHPQTLLVNCAGVPSEMTREEEVSVFVLAS